jgi:hypothetical protein
LLTGEVHGGIRGEERWHSRDHFAGGDKMLYICCPKELGREKGVHGWDTELEVVLVFACCLSESKEI